MSLAVRLDSVGKCYPTFSSNLARFARWFGVATRPVHEFWAVQDISFTLAKGQALALIGQNGAGKSTVLKLVTGVVRPTSGAVMISGRVGAILELGLGFNPDLTGRQNAYLAGGLMGLGTVELDSLMAGIVEFSELEEFFDHPLRTYSSGMQARLAFSVATAVRPDLLVVDEVLSVGDSYFQHKSFDRIRRFREQGTALLFVSHGLADVRVLCDSVILLERGRIVKQGLPDEVIDYYNAFVAARENGKLSIEQRRASNGWSYTRSGSGAARIEGLAITDTRTGGELQVLLVGQEVRFECRVAVAVDLPRLVLGVLIRNREGLTVWGTNTYRTSQVIEGVVAGTRLVFAVDFTCTLGPGSYSVSLALVSSDSNLVDNFDWIDNFAVFDVINADRPYFIGSNFLDARISWTQT